MIIYFCYLYRGLLLQLPILSSVRYTELDLGKLVRAEGGSAGRTIGRCVQRRRDSVLTLLTFFALRFVFLSPVEMIDLPFEATLLTPARMEPSVANGFRNDAGITLLGLIRWIREIFMSYPTLLITRDWWC